MLHDSGPQQQIKQVIRSVALGLCLAANQSFAGAREKTVNIVLVENEKISAEDKGPLAGRDYPGGGDVMRHHIFQIQAVLVLDIELHGRLVHNLVYDEEI